VRFEVRLAEERPVAGLIVAQVAGSDRMIYLHPASVVGNDDIAQSWVSPEGEDRFGVVVEFLPSGAARMREATTAHLGRPVAILVDGAVVLAPIVRSPIGESAVIGGHYTQREAERIANGIERR
jgi:preprotein translocase subunit SecD